MAKGAQAKLEVENIIRNAFGKNFLGVADKKLYVKANDGDGEMVDICITMTCPKTPFTVEGTMDTFTEGNFSKPDEYKPAEITSDEINNVRKLIKELGL